MDIVLLIFKILGIVLLILLCFLVLLLFLVVFFPVSYRLGASYQETLTARVKVHWLFHFVSVTLDYSEDKKRCILRLLGIPLADFLNPKPKKVKKEKRKAQKRKSKSQKKKKERPNKEKTKSEEKSQEKNPIKEPVKKEAPPEPEAVFRKEEPEQTKTEPGKTKAESGETKTEAGETKNLRAKLWDFMQRIFQFPKRLWQVIKNMLQKCRDLWNKGIDIKEKLEKWIEILTRERTKTAVGKAKRQICRLLKHILPRKWNAYVNFGFEDPALTGQILGYYWMFIGLWAERLICVPDFEHKTFSGNIRAKGHIQVFQLIYAAYQFLFDKDLVYLRKLGSEMNSD